jgi:phage tail-like protein
MAATTATRNDPYLGYRFRLEISGIQSAGFSEVTLPDFSVAATPYREGTDGPTRKLSGQTEVGTLSLQRGMTSTMDLYNWFQKVSDVGATVAGRKSVSIILVDQGGNETVRWNLTNCWPSKYSSSGFNASGNDVMIETLELQCESITRVS